VSVATVRAKQAIALLQCLANPNRHGLLTYREMNGTAHFLFSVTSSHSLFYKPYEQHFVEQTRSLILLPSGVS
jgi:hypothetical protein